MIAILSPAKTLDLESPLPHMGTSLEPSQPPFLDKADRLVTSLRNKSRPQLQQMMSISEALADLNYERYQTFSTPFTADNARPAIYTFAGDVYDGLDAYSLPLEAITYAQQTVRILSGLYGLLRPLDLMQPYRLEMGCDYKPPYVKDLPEYWQDDLTEQLQQDLAGHSALLNLASNEYAQAVDFDQLEVPVVKIDFKEEKNGKLRILSFYAKKARGMMTRYLVQQRPEQPADLRGFDAGGYRFRQDLSSEHHLVFSRPQP